MLLSLFLSFSLSFFFFLEPLHFSLLFETADSPLRDTPSLSLEREQALVLQAEREHARRTPPRPSLERRERARRRAKQDPSGDERRRRKELDRELFFFASTSPFSLLPPAPEPLRLIPRPPEVRRGAPRASRELGPPLKGAARARGVPVDRSQLSRCCSLLRLSKKLTTNALSPPLHSTPNRSPPFAEARQSERAPKKKRKEDGRRGERRQRER